MSASRSCHQIEHKPLLLILQPFLLNNFERSAAKVNYGINNIEARGTHPRESVAGRAGRVLVDRTVDTLRRQCEASQRSRPREDRRIDPQMGVDQPGASGRARRTDRRASEGGRGSSRSGALSPPARHCRASSCVRQTEGFGEEHLLTYSALALAFSADCRLTIRGGGNRQWTWHRCRQREWARRPGASPPMRMTASWSGSERTYRIQVCGAKMRPNGELPSDQYAARRTSDTGASKKRPVSLSIVPPRAQASRRCETQATLGGKPPSSASVSVP